MNAFEAKCVADEANRTNSDDIIQAMAADISSIAKDGRYLVEYSYSTPTNFNYKEVRKFFESQGYKVITEVAPGTITILIRWD